MVISTYLHISQEIQNFKSYSDVTCRCAFQIIQPEETQLFVLKTYHWACLIAWQIQQFTSFLLVLPIARLRSRRSTKPTKYCDSLDTTTGKPLCSVSLSSVSTSSTVIESWVSTLKGSLCLKQVLGYGQIQNHTWRSTTCLRYDAVWSGRTQVVFLRNTTPPSSSQKHMLGAHFDIKQVIKK
jgi:hypothetical protein